MNIDEETVKAVKCIIRGMRNHGKIGGAHTEDTTVMRRMRFCSRPAQKNAKEFLKKSGWKFSDKKTHEDHYALHPDKVREVDEFLNANMEESIRILHKYI